MSLKEFRRAGHAPTLASAFLYFDVSFMVWVILGPLGPFLGESLKLSASQKGFLTALPLLGGSFFRIILGLMTERIGGRRTGLIGLSLTLVPLLIAWQWASTFGQFLGVRPAPVSRRPCRSPAVGTRRNIKAWPWGSPARATREPCWQLCSPRGSPRH
jgi:MFS family permease